MAIEHLKRWHWVAVSVPLGLVAAWAMLDGGPLGLQGRYATMGVEEFESRVLGRPRWFGRGGEPPQDVRLYPLADGDVLVTAYLPVGPPQRDERRRWFQRYRAHQLTRGGTYVPLSPMRDPAQFRLKFDDKDPLAQARLREVAQSGWQPAEPGARTVTADPATLRFPLRKGAAYVLTIQLAAGQEATAAGLSLTLNDVTLPALVRDPAEPSRWRVAVPSGATKDGTQVLGVAAPAGRAVRVVQVELVNPRYTIRDFLDDAKRQNPSLDYAYQWLWEPRVAYLAWTVGSVAVVGGIWPTLLAWMVGAGYGRPAAAGEYDLSRFQGRRPRTGQREADVPAADDAKVRALADELERKLAQDAAQRSNLPPDPPAPAEPVKTQVAAAPLGVDPGGKPAEPKTYGGEYYPVARKVEKRKGD